MRWSISLNQNRNLQTATGYGGHSSLHDLKGNIEINKSSYHHYLRGLAEDADIRFENFKVKSRS